MNQKEQAEALASALHPLVDRIHSTAVSHGWWDGSPLMDPDASDVAAFEGIAVKLALVHSEVSEALEEARVGKISPYVNEDSPKPEGLVVELADAVIRILDLIEMLGETQNFSHALCEKVAYNETRAFRHGGKLG